MKFPLAPRPFLPVEPTPDKCAEYEATARAVLLETIAEYDDYVHRKNRTMNKKRWKAVKTRENVTVYKKRDLEDVALLSGGAAATGAGVSRTKAGSTISTSSTSSGSTGVSASAIMDWPLPKLLGVGTIVGSLEDVMYGVISPDSDCVKVKTTYVDDELVDGQILCQLKHATREDPFLFLGLKWFVKAHPASINAVVWPRDLVFVEGTGVHETPAGERIGYHLMHSVELPECHPLTSLGILRGGFSSCFLFKQLANGTVEVYMKTFVEPAGNLPDALAIMSAANGLIGCWKSVWCAQNKKLAWMMQDAARQRRLKGSAADRVTVHTNGNGKQCCAICDHSLSGFRSASACELCRRVVCSKCRTARKITFVHNHGDATKVPAVFCKNCITKANNTSSAEVARHEYVLGESANRWHPTPSNASYALTDSLSDPPSELNWESAGSEVDTIHDWEDRNHLPVELLRQSMASYTPRSQDGELAITPRRPEHDMILLRPPAPPQPHQYHHQYQHQYQHHYQQARAPPPVDPQQELWMRMNQLRVQAEQAYQTTRSNNRAMYETTKGRPF